MKSFNCTPQSWPLLPDTTTHHLWQAWDMTLESFISSNVAMQKGSIMVDPRNNLSASMSSNLSFFTDQLAAFDLWLEFGTALSEPPEQLPVVLQALLSQTHRLRALHLLRKYLSLGPSAVNLSLMVGIYPYILKLLQSPADDVKQTLIAIWASIMGFDPTCRQELIREKAQGYFIQFLQSKGLPANQRCLAAFVLAEMCNQHKEGQQTCLDRGLHRVCTSTLAQPEVLESAMLKKWICLCLYKLCEEHAWAKYLCITEAGHTQLYPLLADPDPTVRTAAVLALGELFGASTLSASLAAGAGSASAPGTPSRMGMMSPSMDSRSRQASFNGAPEERDLREAELNLVWQILDCCMDGSIIVRLETIFALGKCIFLPAHLDCIKMVAKAVRKRNLEKKTDKGGKRTVSPGLNPDGGPKINYSHPWHLTQAETSEIIAQVEQYIESQAQAQAQELLLPRSLSGSVFDRFSPTVDHVGPGIAVAADGAAWLQLDPPGAQGGQGIQQPSPRTVPTGDASWLSVSPVPTASATSGIAGSGGSGASGGDAPPPPRSSPRAERADIPLGRKASDRTGSVGSAGPESHPATPSPYSLMASVYVRLWLALTEVQGKDPSNVVVNAAAAIRFKVYALISNEENNTPQIEIGGETQDIAIAAPMVRTPANRATSPYMQWGGSPLASPARKQVVPSSFDDAGGDGFSLASAGKRTSRNNLTLANASPPPAFPLGSELPPVPPSTSGKSGKVAYRGSQPLDPADSSVYSFGAEGGSTTPGPPGSLSRSGSFGAPVLRKGTSTGSIGEPAHDSIDESGSGGHSLSRTFENSKAQFLRPDPGYVAVDDPLSLEGANRAYRNWRIQAIVAHERHIAELFKGVIQEDKDELYMPATEGSSRKNKNGADDSLQARQTAVANLPQSVTKFEEKILLTINNSVMTSLVMFHAFQDIIAVSDDSTVSIWSLANSSRIMEIKNKHTVTRNPQRDFVKRINTVESSLFTPLSEPRITAMNWINESYNALLMLGSDDGVVKVWRDTSSSDAIEQAVQAAPAGRGSINAGSNGAGTGARTSSVELATAFMALPDIAETSRGSGLLLSWQQATGTLFAGGNSNSIRVWDLGREQCVRVFDTGTKLCLTALATTVGAFAPSPLSSPQAHRHSTDFAAAGSVDVPLAWAFAGFADGSVGVYDERVASAGGRVHFSRDHSAWIVSAHMRADAQEVITSSVRGMVKFWDIRTWRTYKTLEVQKSPLTSMSVHNCAPLIATGSHAQFIKILTFGGEQLGNIIKYHDGFMGQRMGPITSLTFHPHRMMLAASAADCIISIYGTADDAHTHAS